MQQGLGRVYISFSLKMGLVLLALGTSGCSRVSEKLWNALGDDAGLISNRPTPEKEAVVMIKLAGAPLLDQTTGEGSDLKIPAEVRTKLQTEQARILEELKRRIPEAELLFTYQYTVNALAVLLPIKDIDKLQGIVGVSRFQRSMNFSKPKWTQSSVSPEIQGPQPHELIGADRVYQMRVKDSNGQEIPVRGKGVRVGIIDSGIDFTHSMFGGPGTEQSFKEVDPKAAHPGFPNHRVVGGMDFVGTEYDASSVDERQRIPRPDVNPLDETGHGSHVAGTVAGLGDGQQSLDGIAPDAELYALKVFGGGSTSDAVIVAAMEWAVDPNKDGDLSDRLHILNLSLGSDFGLARGFYREVVQRLDRSGVAVVIAAGNEGDVPFIAGAPGVVDDAFTVAASIDNSWANTRFQAVSFDSASLGHRLTEAVEGSVGKKISELQGVQGELLHVGLADKDFTQDVKDQLKGKVALIDRGVVPFEHKVKRASEAGAIGVVVANNQPGAPFEMGGEKSYPLPAIMITQALGTEIKALLGAGEAVSVNFTTGETIDRPELADTITDFSSRGPRSGDYALKPEISAPGNQILSAAVGSGNKTVRFSGTSMATPHMAGVLALVRQAHPQLTPQELKALIMGRSKPLKEPIARQGAGRVQVDAAITSPLVALPAGISLGEVLVQNRKVIPVTLKLRSLRTEKLKLTVEYFSQSGAVTLLPVAPVELGPDAQLEVPIRLQVDARQMTEKLTEMAGWILVKQEGLEVFRIPLLGVVRRISQIQAKDLVVAADSGAGDAGAEATLKLANEGAVAGDVLLFNALGVDQRKPNVEADKAARNFCDLQAAGYRVVKKTLGGKDTLVLQVVAKLYQPMTNFNMCQLSVLLDGDDDGNPDQELGAVANDAIQGLKSAGPQDFSSVLLDFAQMRKIRTEAERSIQNGGSGALDYKPALLTQLPLLMRNHSTVLMVEAPVSALKTSKAGHLKIRLATLDEAADQGEFDDYFAPTEKGWMDLSILTESQSYVGLPETLTLAPGETRSVRFQRGLGSDTLLILSPDNATNRSDTVTDQQMELKSPRYFVDFE